MPVFERDDVSLYYEVYGTGFPVLLFAPGGMRSSIEAWKRAAYDPIERLAGEFRLIALDQRNAGRSTAPVTREDGWDDYTRDHIALLDHLEVERCAVLGNCIGGSYCLGLIEAQPSRIAAGVLQQPIGSSADNRMLFFDMFDAWAADLDGVSKDALRDFRERMYGGDFVFNVTREFVSSCSTPLLVLMGDDPYHPSAISREIVELAQNARLVERWKDPDCIERTISTVIEFLEQHR